MRVLLVDAFDSFVYVVKNYVDLLGADTTIVRVNRLAQVDPLAFDAVILGPGPGRPEDCGYLEFLDQVAGRKPVFGICLGMQAIAVHAGAQVVRASSRQHGKVSGIRNDGKGCFKGLPDTFDVTRYHSLVADETSVSHVADLEISARSLLDGYVMGLRRNRSLMEGVQFHPESIGSQYGHQVIANFFQEYCGSSDGD